MANREPDAALSTALKGATLAFNGQKIDSDKPKPKPQPGPKAANLKTSISNGALLAATQASRGHSSDSRSRSPTSPLGKSDHGGGSRAVSRQVTGGSVQDHGVQAQDRELQHGTVTKKLSQYLGTSSGSPYLLSPGGKSGPDHRSASFIAATLAASRSVSPSPHHTGQGYFAHSPQPAHSPLAPGLARRRSVETSSINSSTADLGLPDTSSIPPTNSLISMFEKQKDVAAPVKDPLKKFDTSPMQPKVGSRPKLRARTPPRLPSLQAKLHPPDMGKGDGRVKQAEAKESTESPPPRAKPRPVAERSKTPPQVVRRATTEIMSPKPQRLGAKPSLQRPAVRPRATAESLRTVPVAADKPLALEPTPPSTSDERPDPAQVETEHGGPEAPTLIRKPSVSSESSDDTFVSASSTRSPRPGSPATGREGPAASVENLSRIPAWKRAPSPPKPNLRRTSSMHINPSKPSRLRPVTRTSTTVDSNHPNGSSMSTLPLDSLTSAIMAGNLAANRAPLSVTLPPPIPAPRRPGHKHFHPHHHHHTLPLKHHHSGNNNSNNNQSSSRSPPRQTGTLLTTLRHPPSRPASDEEEGNKHHRRRKPLQSKKKHAHHEGARKRWREEVSARERKRYEAVWASNRGLFADRLPPPLDGSANNNSGSGSDTPDTDLVLNVVVRDIWSRSRLPFDELAEVWDLVYHGRNGGLNREEFVVGMWLIDQRLRGRKIPARVSDSVWNSARGMSVKMPKGKKK